MRIATLAICGLTLAFLTSGLAAQDGRGEKKKKAQSNDRQKTEQPGEMRRRGSGADNANSPQARRRGADAKGGAKMNPERIFQRLDKNKDGVLAFDEVPERMRKRLAQMDTDGSKTISKKEMMAAINKRQKMQSQKQGQKGAEGKPTDENGKGRRPDRLNPEAMMKRLDKNNDQLIAMDEVPEKMREKLAKLDGNGDGSLDLKELKKISAKKKGKEKSKYDTDSEKTRSQLPKRPPTKGG